VVVALLPQSALLAQVGAAVSVPFVGCKSDGQVGPKEAPKGIVQTVPISATAARGLAYYKSADGPGVLAPRGWYCFGTYGSSGSTLYVSPKPIDITNLFSRGWRGFDFEGPAVEMAQSYGGTSGRVVVAEMIARVFPAYQSSNVVESFDLPTFTHGPYPKDVLRYKSKAVEYKTPAQTEGLGTHSGLLKNSSPIEGVAILTGDKPPDVLHLSVRLPPELSGLTPVIVGQFERDAR
jgi:hypothetical protein